MSIYIYIYIWYNICTYIHIYNHTVYSWIGSILAICISSPRRWNSSDSAWSFVWGSTSRLATAYDSWEPPTYGLDDRCWDILLKMYMHMCMYIYIYIYLFITYIYSICIYIYENILYIYHVINRMNMMFLFAVPVKFLWRYITIGPLLRRLYPKSWTRADSETRKAWFGHWCERCFGNCGSETGKLDMIWGNWANKIRTLGGTWFGN